MKISIGSKIINGPWGGGNLFVINLSNYLISKGHEVIFDLTQNDIDIVVLTDPRSKSDSTSKFNHYDILQYKKFVNPHVKVVQRINECDERKNTDGINRFYLEASDSADTVVFVSRWLESIYLNMGLNHSKSKVIMSGSDENIFRNQSIKTNKKKYKLVTHHWSAHENKGFDTYYKIDEMLEDDYWKELIEFTYIGNIPKNHKFKNTRIVQPLDGFDLARELNMHNIYVTGSINEPSGNHHIEAALCGLPIVYKQSGGLPEYCLNYGVSFNKDFELALNKLIKNYDLYTSNLKNYPYNSNTMCKEYLELFHDLVNEDRLSTNIRQSKLLSIIFRNRQKILNFYYFTLKENLKSTLSNIKKIIVNSVSQNG